MYKILLAAGLLVVPAEVVSQPAKLGLTLRARRAPCA